MLFFFTFHKNEKNKKESCILLVADAVTSHTQSASYKSISYFQFSRPCLTVRDIFFFSSVIIMGVNVNCLSYNRWLNEWTWTHIGTLWVFLLLCAVAAIETINLLISCFLYIFSRNLTKELFELLFHFLVPFSCPNETLTDVKCLTVTGQQHQQANKWRGVIWTSFIVVFV